MRLRLYLFFLLSITCASLSAQEYWQQEVDYQIDARLDDQNHALQGRLRLKYRNNSPDTLKKVYFHLFWNLANPTGAYAEWAASNNRPLYDQLRALPADAVGKMEVFLVQQNGSALEYRVAESLLEAVLNRPLAPNDDATFQIAWQAKIPQNILGFGKKYHSGDPKYLFYRWYPQICPYDRYGRHLVDVPPSALDGGEFGRYSVEISLPKNYLVAATGELSNPEALGRGYEKPGTAIKPNYGLVNTWKFKADRVQDFGWIADPDLRQQVGEDGKGNTLRVFMPAANFDSLRARAAAAALSRALSLTGDSPYRQISMFSSSQTPAEIPGLMAFNPEKTDKTADFWTILSWYFAYTDNSTRSNPLTDATKWQKLYQSVGESAFTRAVRVCRDSWGFKRVNYDEILRIFEKVSEKELDGLN